MKKNLALGPAGVICLVLSFYSCTASYEEFLVTYQEESTGSLVEAVYRNYYEGGVSTVTLTWEEGGSPRTLPQGMAASGVRYTDEKTLTWWTKGEGAFMEVWQEGVWKILGNYREVPTP